MQNNLFLSFENQLKLSFTPLKNLASLLVLIIIVASCGVKYTPVQTFADQDKERHQRTETFLKTEHSDKEYKSLAFGKTIVYKPNSFQTLDSLYAVKQEYIDNDELRDLKTSGVEEMIENYRPIAQRDIGEVRYEFEHIFYIEKKDSTQVNHDYFVLDHQDSIVTHTPFYSYTIPKTWKELHNSYLFDFHFVTDRDLFISIRERDFIEHFKAREEALIGEPELQSFMIHTLRIMRIANQINSIDYNSLTKQLSLNIVKTLSNDAIIESFGTLIALEDENNNVLGYERSITWSKNNIVNETKVIFNAYLEILEMKTVIKDK
jgi:hypothetical protein